MRLPLAASIETRDGILGKDVGAMNAAVEVDGNASVVIKRPAADLIGHVAAGQSQLLSAVDSAPAVVVGDVLRVLSVGAGVSETETVNLAPVFPGLPLLAQVGDGVLVIKSGREAWVYTS